MADKIILCLCAYNEIGVNVLKQALSRRDISNIILFTHEAAGSTSSEIIDLAKENDIWWSTEKITVESLPIIPDIVASVYYREIIRSDLIKLVKGRIFNVHPSLLPAYRGCSSVPWAIIDGVSQTGITYHYIDEGVDTGKIILQKTIQIADNDTQATLYAKCMEKGALHWQQAFELVRSGVCGVDQDSEGVSYFKRGAPNRGHIDDRWPTEKIERFIRAMIYPPYPPARYRNQEVYCLEDFYKIKDADKNP